MNYEINTNMIKERMRKNSTRGDMVPKRVVDKVITITILLSTLATTTLALGIQGLNYGIEKILDLNQQGRITENISTLLGTEMNIVAKNTHRTKDNSNSYYDTYGIAKDIASLEPSLYDLALYNTYVNIEYNRTNNMDNVVLGLCNQAYSSDNSFIKSKLGTARSFDEYLKVNGYVDEYENASIEKFVETGEMLEDLLEDYLEQEVKGKGLN